MHITLRIKNAKLHKSDFQHLYKKHKDKKCNISKCQET